MGPGMSRICTICARGGSKGVPGKNIRQIGGKPLLAHTVSQALESGLFDAVGVSSDSEEILAVAREAGAHLAIRRPAEMATDTAGKMPAIQHAALAVEAFLGKPFETLVDLDATSPLRDISDIVGAVALLENAKAPSVITGSPARRSPYFNLVETDADGFVRLCKGEGNVARRQDAPDCFDMNASIYVWSREAFLSRPTVFYPGTRIFVMPEDRSHDIDSELDFAIVQMLMERKHGPV
jgi:N-acylneuraminate cytidylyltransferase/CMP-N,N'-diacetyllegionaminic acid synthase